MKLQSRIKQIEKRMKPPENKNVVWDFSNTTDDQLLKLEHLVKTDKPEAERFTKELIEGGFLKAYEHKK